MSVIDRIKRWLARPLTIHKRPSSHRQREDAVQWVYCASSRNCCPVFPDDKNLLNLDLPEQP
jgi:hypothetical protein